MKKTITLVFTLLAIMSLSAQTLKFGHIDSQELMTTLPEMDAVMNKLEETNTTNNELLAKMQNELQKELATYQSSADTMAQAMRAYKEQELQQMQQNIQTFYQTAQQSMQEEQAKLTQPVMDKVRKAIDDVAAEQGLIYVFDLATGSVLYHSSQSLDLKPLVRKKLGLE